MFFNAYGVKKQASTRRMYSIIHWIEKKLGLKVNTTETKVTPPSKVKCLILGFGKDKNDGKQNFIPTL